MPATTLSPQTGYAVAAGHPCWLEVDEVPIIAREGILLGILYHRTLRSKAGEARLSSGDGLETAPSNSSATCPPTTHAAG